MGKKTLGFVQTLLEHSQLSTADVAKISWETFGECVVVDTLDEAYKLADDYAYEHVEIFTKQPRDALTKVKNYGSLFLGEQTCVSYGDKVGSSKENVV